MKIPMNMHNCFTTSGTEGCTVDERIAPLIERLSRKHPSWQFIAKGLRVNGTNAYRKFIVEEDGEELGEIEVGRNWRTYEDQFEMDNRRLRSKRERSGATKTKLLDKAVKIIDHNFFGKTFEERKVEARSATTSIVSHVAQQKHFEYVRRFESNRDLIAAYIADHWETMQHTNFGQRLGDLPAEIEKVKAAQAMSAASSQSQGVTIMLWRGNYHCAHTGTEFTNETIPPAIAMAVGMLKLVEVKEFIPDIGMRVADNVFYVMNAEKPSEPE